MTTHILIADDFGRNSLKRVVVHDTEIMDNKGRMAMVLIEKWGMITGTISGEDTAGRSKIVDLTPQEVVDRACSIADITIETFRAKGWFITAPGPEALAHSAAGD